MKRFVKGCLIVFIILAVTGTVLLGAAAFRGFRWSVLRETSQEGSLHIGPLYMYIDEPFGLNFVWSRQEGAPKDGAAGNRCTTYAFDTSQIRCLRINSGPGDVKICSGDGGSEKIEVQVAERNYTRYEVSQNGYELNITGKNSWNGIWIGRHRSSEVVVYVPEDLNLEELELCVGAGDLEVNAPLETDSLYVDTGVGDMELSQELRVNGDARIEVGTGDITIEKLNCLGSLDSSCGVGDLQLRGTVSGDVMAKCGTGDMEIRLDGDPDMYNYELSCGVGTLYVNGTEYSSLKKNLVIHNGDEYPDIFLDTGVGDLHFTLD